MYLTTEAQKYTHSLLFRFKILTMSCFIVAISSLLLVATNKVRDANASLLIIAFAFRVKSNLFFSKNNRKQAAAMRLLPSTKA